MTLRRFVLTAVALASLCACFSVWAPGPVAAAATAGVREATGRSTAHGARSWWFIPRGAHRRPGIPGAAARLLRRYSGVWVGDRRHRVVYLTFDAADEVGTTRRIVHILDRARVKASFFLTGHYMRAHRRLVRRIARHGHLVCNHTYSHPSMARVARRPGAFARQLRATERAYRVATGGELARFFRPPYGRYSARSLRLAEKLRYTTVFWSFAHYDYDERAQPPASVTLGRILRASHPGAVYLLHASSRSNTNALARAIRGLKRRGYRFATVDALRTRRADVRP